MRGQWQRWRTFLLAPVDAASLGAFRIVFGAMVAIDAYRFLSDGRVEEYFLEPKVHFTYIFFDFVRPWPGQWMHAHLWIMGGLALLVSAGLFYRIAAILLCIAYAWFFLIEQSIYMNHYYLILLVCFLLIWIPADREFSLDRRRRALGPPVVPRCAVLILRFQLFVVYFYGALAKLNADWLRAEPMYSIIAAGGPQVPPIAHTFPPGLLAYAIAYGGLAVDFAIPLLLVFPRTVAYGFGLAFVFHALNAIFLNIGIFSYLAVGAITIFFPYDWPRRLFRLPHVATGAPSFARSRGQLVLLVGLHLYVLAQVLIPFRHLLYPGVVSWTEEGHRFAWHMKLRHKKSVITLHVTDPATGRTWTINPREDLRPRQFRKIGTFPDIMLQYVHYQRDQLHAQGIEHPIITVDWACSLNGRPYQRLVDPTINFANVERSMFHADWILALDGDPRARVAQDSIAPDEVTDSD